MSSSDRQVVDPVTNTQVVVHDNTDNELDGVLPDFNRALAAEDDGAGYSAMDDVVRREAGSAWWKDHDSNKLRMKVALVVALSAAFGCSGSILLILIFNGIHLGALGWTLLLVGSVFVFPALAAFSFLFLVNQPRQHHPEPQQPPEYRDEPEQNPSQNPESAAWLNTLLHSVWGIVNPALFTSVCDMLEDALQSSMPKMIKAVKVADLSQGTEPLRILGIHALRNTHKTDDFVDDDFINLEVAIAYRATNQGSGLRDRSQNAHILMQFWASGSVVLPVWVELTGIIATIRLRLQLTPNPPFLSAMTFTFLGQPKLNLKCTPLAKNFVNIMDIPGLSGWLNSTIDATLATYVAPRSMSLDLKAMLLGREKQDTDAVGVVIVTVRRAYGFKHGDNIKVWKSKEDRQGDAYVTVGWAKWGKPLWSSRIIENENSPIWEETAAILVTPSDINADERLRLQLCDSDRFTADDILGMVDVPLKDLMSNADTLNKTFSRKDQLVKLDGSPHKGHLDWQVGFFQKTTVKQRIPDEKNLPPAAQETYRQLSDSEKDGKLDTEDSKEKIDQLLADLSPSDDFPSGILSIRIVQIAGLEVQNPRLSGIKGDAEDEEDTDLPSPYCSIIVNHQLVYKTRKKMKSNRPYFDAGTERFIRDWRTTDVIIAVHDSRLHEHDPLIGIVVLPLSQLFQDRSQITDSAPLIGGLGYGRIQFSATFRSVQPQLHRQLLGWDLGTLEVIPNSIKAESKLVDLTSCTMYLRTKDRKGKLKADGNGNWNHKGDQPVHLAVQKRYSSCLLVQFKKHAIGPDVTVALSTLWFKDIPDDEECTLALPIIRNENNAFDRARLNAIDVELGEVVGTLHLKLRFWPGLSGYHKAIAEHDSSMADVMEVLDCEQELSGADNSNSAEEEDEEDSSSSSSEGGGIVSEIKQYGQKKEALHRKHRGLLQWSGARNIVYARDGIKGSVGNVTQKMKGKLKHTQASSGVENEV